MAKNLWLIFFIIISASFLRLYHLDKVPPSLFSDEVDLGYQAYSFLKTGKDYFGNFLPVHFHSFADFRTPLYLYSAVPTIAIFGLNEWGVRLPAAIYGVLSIVFFFFLIKQISGKVNLALLGALLLSVTPWHIHYSRAGFEVTSMLFLLSFGFWMFYKELPKKKGFFFSAVILALVFYSYAPVKLFLPLLIFSQAIFLKKEILKTEKKKLFFSGLIFLVFLLPMIKDSFLGKANFRLSYINIFSQKTIAGQINQWRAEDAFQKKLSGFGVKPPLISYFFHNKPISWFLKFLENYLSAFSPSFLFSQGDPNLRHSLPNFGLILPFFLPFLLVGLLSCPKNLKENYFWFIFLFLAPVSSALTIDGANHATRLSLMVLPLVYFSALGVRLIINSLKKNKFKHFFYFLGGLLLLANVSYYLHFYYSHYPFVSERFWHFGLKEGINKILKLDQENKYDQIVLSSSYEQPLIFFLFWSKQDPAVFKIQNLKDFNVPWFQGKQYGKYYFGEITDKYLENLVADIKRNDYKKILYLAARNDFQTDLERNVPEFLKVIDKITLPSGEPILYLLRTKTLLEYQK